MKDEIYNILIILIFMKRFQQNIQQHKDYTQAYIYYFGFFIFLSAFIHLISTTDAKIYIPCPSRFFHKI